MSTLASQIASLTIVNSIIYLSSASLALVRGIHRWAVNSPHKGPVTRKMFPFDDVFMMLIVLFNWMQFKSKYNYFVWNGSICKCQKVSKHNMTFKYSPKYSKVTFSPWWRHQMETFSALLAICAGNSPGTGDWPQKPVTRSFAVFFDVRPNKQLSKQSWRWWFETLSPSLWRHRRARHLFFPQLGSRTTIKQYGLVRNRNLLGQDDNILPSSIKKSGRTVSVYLFLFQDYCVWSTLSHNKSLVFFCRSCDFSFLSILTSHGPGIHFKGYKNV